MLGQIEWLSVLLSVAAIGGERTDQFEACVAVEVRGTWGASGVLVGPNVVLTAGHVLRTSKGTDPTGGVTQVYVGADLTRALDKQGKPAGSGFFRVKRAVRHPDFAREVEEKELKGQKAKFVTYRNDLAMLILEQPVPRSVATPVTLAPPDLAASAKDALAVGFGAVELIDGYIPRGLGVKRSLRLDVVSNGEDRASQARFKLTPGAEMVLCDPNRKNDLAAGDGGGAVYVEAEGRRFLAGIVSRSVPPTEATTKRAGEGSICVRVDRYKKWMIEAARQAGGTVGTK